MNINWRLVAGIVLLIVVVGYVGFLQAKVGSLERQLETRISVITPEDLKTLRDMVKANRDAVASLERRTDFFGERLTLVGSTLERIATRVAQPGPPGPAGPPGTPASPPGSPLRPPAPIPGSTGMVNPADLVRARLIWPERILLPQVGPGLSASFASNFGVGYGYLYTGTGFVQSAYLTYRP